METTESPQQSSGDIDENRESTSGINDNLKYVNGEIDSISQQHAVLTTMSSVPLDMSVEGLSTMTMLSSDNKSGAVSPKPTTVKQKRDTHNEIERRRKCKINIGIIKLGDIIPSCINAKLSKNQILEHAAQHIFELRAKCEKLLTSNASEMQAEEIKNLMKDNEQLRSENRKFKDLMKALQIPPNGVANPTAYLKGKGKTKIMPLPKSTATSGTKAVITNAPKVLTTNQNATILPLPNQIGGVTQVGANQIVNQGAAPGTPGNAILVQNPNGGYFLVPTNKNMTIPLANNQGTQNIVPNQITVVNSSAGQVVNSSNKVTIGQGSLNTSSVGTTTTATTQAVSTPITSTAPGASMQAPMGMQTIRYIVPMMPGSTNQTTPQTMMMMAKPNNQPVPIRIAPQQPIRIAGSQPQVILPAPAGGVPVSTNQNITDKSDSKKKSSPPKIKNLCSSDSESESSKVNTTVTQSTIAPAPVAIQANTTNQNMAPNQVVLQRPPGQTTGGPVTMQVVPKQVTQQFVYLQGPNGQLIPVVIQNPNAQQNTVIQQPVQQPGNAPNQTLVSIPINQTGQGMINNRPIVVVSQPGVVASSLSQSTGVITSVSNSITTTRAAMSPLTVLTSQNSSSAGAADDILARAAESIFSPNTLNDNSPTLNLNEMNDDVASTQSTTPSINSLPPFPIKISRATEPGSSFLEPMDSPAVASPVDTDSHGKKQKKNKKKKKKKEKSKEKDKTKDKKDKDKSKHKSKDKEKKKHKQKDKDKKKNSESEKPVVDTTIIKELDRGMANSVDALPDSTSGTAIITDTLLQEWIEKEAGLNINPDHDGDSRDETITNVTANQDKKDEEEEVMDTGVAQTQNASSVPSSYSAESLLAGSDDSPQTTAPTQVTPTATTSSVSTPTTSSGETTATSNSHNPFGSSFPSFNFGSDILSNSMSVSGLPTYIEDEESEEVKSSSSTGLSSLKALGSMRDSILSFGGSQGNQTQTSQPQQPTDEASNEQPEKTADDRSSQSASPVDSLPPIASPPAVPERDVSSPESTHGFSASPEPANLFGSGALSDNMESKDTTSQDQEEEEESIIDIPYTEPASPFPNSSWISNHARASHLASGLKKQKPPVSSSSSSLPIPVPVTTSSLSSSSLLSSSESMVPPAANIPPGFYTLPWLGPPITSASSTSKTTPTSQESGKLESSSGIQSEKTNSIPTPTYLPTPRSPSPSYAPSQQSSATSYAPMQRSTSPTYVPSSHHTSPPLFFPKLASAQSSMSASSPLSIDTSMPPSIFSSSGSLNTPTNCSVITTAPQATSSVSTTNASAKYKLRPPSKKKFSPSTIHRTLTSGITEEESPEKGEEPKPESRPPQEQQQHKEWQHKLPMQIKPGPEIRPKEGPLGVIGATAQPTQLKTKGKRSKKKKAALAAAAAALAASRKDLEDIGKREMPKHLVDQFPWLDDAEEEEKKAAKNKSQLQSDRSSSFSIQSITQQSPGKVMEMPHKLTKAIPTPQMPLGIPSSITHNKDISGFSQSNPVTSGTEKPFWNPSTTGSYPRSTDSATSVPTTKQSSVDTVAPLVLSKSRIEDTVAPLVFSKSRIEDTVAPLVLSKSRIEDTVAPLVLSKSRIEYMPRQSPTGYSSISSSANLPQPNQQTSPVSNFGASGDDKEMLSPLGLTSTSQMSDNQQTSSRRSRRKSSSHKKQKQTKPGNKTASPLHSPPDSTLFSDFPLGLAPNLLSNQGIDSRSAPTGPSQNKDSNQRLQMESQISPPSQRAPSRSSALPTPPADNFLFSPTSNSSNSSANQSSVFPNPATNKSDNNQSDVEDFMTLAQAEKSLEFLPSSPPDQSQNVDPIDLSSLPMFDTPASTPRSTPSSVPSSTQRQQQQQENQLSGRSSVERQPSYGQSPPNHPSNLRTGPPNQMYSMPNTTQHAQRKVAVTSSQSITAQTAASRSQAQNRFMPSPEQSMTSETAASRSQAQNKFMPSPEDSMTAQNAASRSQTQNRFIPSPDQSMTSQTAASRSEVQNRFMPSPETSSQSMTAQTAAGRSQVQNRFMPSPDDSMNAQTAASRSQIQNRVMPSPETSSHSMTAPTAPSRSQAQNRFMPSPEQSMTSQTAASRSQVQNRFMPSPEMQHQNQGTKRPANDIPQSEPSSKRPAGVGNPHHNQHPMPLMHGQDTNRGALLERSPQPLQTSHMHRVEPSSQTSHIHRVEQGMPRGQTPPTAANQQVGSPHGGLQVVSPHGGLHHNPFPGEQQPPSGSEMSRVPTYDLSQSVAHHRKRSVEMASSSRPDMPRAPTYDLSQSVGSQRNRPIERQTSVSDSHRTPRYDLSQSAGAPRTQSVEQNRVPVSETQRIPTYDLTQSAGTQRSKVPEPQRMPTYDLTQNAGTQRSKVSEPQRIPPYDLAQNAGTQRSKISEPQRMPMYDLSQITGAQRSKISEPQRMPPYDLTQIAGTQRSKATEPQRMPPYDLTQSAGTQRPNASEQQRIPSYDLTQTAGAQRSKASETQRMPPYNLSQIAGHRPKASEQQRIPSYDLTQSAGSQRPKASEPQRMSPYDLTQIAGAQRSKVSEPQRMPTYDLSQNAGTQRPKASEPQRMPTYDLTQSAATQRPKASEQQRTQRVPTYDLTQSSGPQRTKVPEAHRMPSYDLTQGAGTQRTRSVERPTSGSEVQRTPVYNLSQGAGVHRNPVERHQPTRSEAQRIPPYEITQSASAQRARSTERPTSASSDSQRIPTYDLTQSPHRDPVPPPKHRKRPQNNAEQYFSPSDNTSSLRHMDSSNIAQESNPWSGFPTQRMSSVHSSEPSFLPNFSSASHSSISQTESVNTSASATIVPSLSPASRRLRTDMPTYLPHHPQHLPPMLTSPPQSSKSSIGREAEISTPFNPMFQAAHTRAGLSMNVAPNFPPVFGHEHAHQAPFNVAKAQLQAGVGVHPSFNFNNIFNDVSGPNAGHGDTPSGIPVHAMHLHANPGMSVEDTMAAHMRGNVPGRHVHGHPQAFGNNMRIDSLLSQNVTADGRTFKVGVPPMGAPFHSFGPGMPF